MRGWMLPDWGSLMVTITIEAPPEAVDALLDCLVLGISEAIADSLMDRPERVSLVDACTALHMADRMQEEMKADKLHATEGC